MSSEEGARDLARELGRIKESIADLALDALRATIHGDEAGKELEKRLARARRAVLKARMLLEGI